MKIEKLSLEYALKSGFTSSSYDQLRHIKTLPYLSVVQATEGSYTIQIGSGAPQNTGHRGFFVAPSNLQQTILHNNDPVSKKIVCRWVFLKVKVNDLYDLDALYDFPIILPKVQADEMDALFDKLFATSDAFQEYVYYHQIINLLHLMATPKPHKASLRIESALRYIESHYGQPITAEEIAREVNLSLSRLFPVFKEATGVSPMAYLNNYRMSVAATELINTEKAIAEIANNVGISDSVYFNKLFRKAYQMSPSQYRKLHQNGSL